MAEKFTTSRRIRNSSDQVTDIVESVKTYARQETIEPLKGAARWVMVGTIASLSLGLASVFFALGVLRLSQDLGGSALDGSWSFIHYFITLVVLAVVVALTFSRIRQRTLAKGG